MNRLLIPRAVVVAVCLLAAVATSVQAQRFEVSAFGGGRWGGSVAVDRDDLQRVDFDNGRSFGVTFGMDLTDSFQVEFMWSRHQSQLTGRSSTADEIDLFGVNIDQYHINVMPQFGDADDMFRPFLLVGAGWTQFFPDGPVPSQGGTSYGVGGGVRLFESDRAGVRVQYRFAPTRVTESSVEWVCGIGGCSPVTDTGFAYQNEVTLGVLFRF